ncbi:MAG: hypothetical protein ONB46_17700 [candidate division KSB1 bacterium]|nr:hypothetical protein [candidate division KSB1 bacterium]MDZ7367636.1 hypothetical protein [candidate division KSB1 bacterium]MDZ7404848.1 hypothetical protein [candidate division KSB1 bacterium]
MLDVIPSAQEIRDKIAAMAKYKKWRPIMVLAIDGAHVPARPEEAKGTRPGRKKQRARRALWKGQWQQAKGFRLYKELSPTAVEVLDFYHCSKHSNQVATEQHPNDPEMQQHGAESTIARLLMNEGQSVIWGLQHLTPYAEQAASEIAKLIDYLKKHLDRMDYQFFRKGGYPIGSGGIESSNKFIDHVRLKRSGAWWHVANAKDVLALRCAKYNGTFDQLVQKKTSKPSVKNT